MTRRSSGARAHSSRAASRSEGGSAKVVPLRRKRGLADAADAASAPPVAAPPEPGAPRLRIRMYRVGLGDCFLLTFAPGTEAEAHVLVDMGSIGQGSGASLDDVAADIVRTTKGELKAIVATHEHADHLSGFSKLAGKIRSEEIWLAWAEDGSDPLARQMEKYRGDLLQATAAVVKKVQAAAARDGGPLGVLRDAVRETMSFHGLGEGEPLAAAGGLKERLHEMKANAAKLATRRVFCSPGDILERPWASGVRFYALGPPRDPAMLRKLGEHGSPDLYELVRAAGIDLRAGKGRKDLEERDSWRPFDNEFLVQQDALGPLGREYARSRWRQIDEAGLGAAADLALQLDNCTNNTSLVLAIEIGDSVMLFPGDAQLGSWLTWGDVKFRVRDGAATRDVTGADLLRAVVFYKVGHHASHNATATKTGLELMGARGLTAFIPLDQKVAQKKRWPMPAPRLEARLLDKTRGRLFRSDTARAADHVPGVDPSSSLYVDFTWPCAAAEDRAVPATA